MRLRYFTVSLAVNGTDDVRLTLDLTRAVPAIDGVALRDGKPVAGAMVVLVPPDPENDQSLFRRAETDSDGSFSLVSVVPGNYTVIAIDRGWNVEWTSSAVLARYLAAGTPVRADASGRYQLGVNVQEP